MIQQASFLYVYNERSFYNFFVATIDFKMIEYEICFVSSRLMIFVDCLHIYICRKLVTETKLQSYILAGTLEYCYVNSKCVIVNV